MDDRRNWKCLFGMHQFSQYSRPETMQVFNGESSSIRPVKVFITHTLKCDFCGKIISTRVNL